MIQLSSGDEDGVAVVGDYDGDGWYDLAVEEEHIAETVRVYAGIGQRLGEWEVRMKPEHCLSGDIDGDGRDEFLCMEGSRVAVYAWKEERSEVSGWPLGEFPSCAGDVDGDGKAELIGAICDLQSPAAFDPRSEVNREVNHRMEDIVNGPATNTEDPAASDENEEDLPPEELAAMLEQLAQEARQRQREYLTSIAKYTIPRGGILNVESGEYTALQFPEGAAYPFNMFRAEAGEIFVADLNRDGQCEIIAKADIGSALFIFNAAGELTYHEEFGKAATMMDVAHTKDGDMLVLLTEDGVLAYP